MLFPCVKSSIKRFKTQMVLNRFFIKIEVV